MIDRRREGDKPCEEFKVLGSTGNVRLIIAESVTRNFSFGVVARCTPLSLAGPPRVTVRTMFIFIYHICALSRLLITFKVPMRLAATIANTLYVVLEIDRSEF